VQSILSRLSSRLPMGRRPNDHTRRSSRSPSQPQALKSLLSSALKTLVKAKWNWYDHSTQLLECKLTTRQTQKDIPAQLLASSQPLTASLVIASFGSPTPYKSKVFDLIVKRDPNAPFALPEKPVRYGKREEIHHIFRSDPRSPPKIISLVFTAAVLAALPMLFGAWLTLGANVNHMSKALGSAPLSHALFFGSIVALEGIFFLYYTSWNLFQTLPAAAAVGAVAFLSGSRALTEVQERRLAGLR